ncbi:hypothetical protein GOV11_04175 [Candidatus Woesearchaeota archaeon]|nr:hypothetical protein [Candidatus Woesearchaeota archaeon]
MTRRTIILPFQGTSEFDRSASIPPPGVPVLDSVTPADQANTIVWDDVSGTTNYNVYFNTTGSVTDTDTKLVVGDVTSFVHSGLTNGVTYFYRVQSEGFGGLSGLSNEDSGVPDSFVNQFSLLFDGVNEFVDFGDNHNYERTVQWSFSAWVRPNNLSSRKTIWAKVSNDANVFGWGFYIETSGKFFAQVRSSGTLRSHLSTAAGFSPLTWTHLCITYSGASNMNGFKVYFNGALDSTGASGSLANTLITTDPSRIAVRNTAFNFVGNTEEVSFWGVELDSTEVSEIYNSGLPTDISQHSQFANNDSWYRMGDGDTFPTITDNGNDSVDGTMTNMESGDIDGTVPT